MFIVGSSAGGFCAVIAAITEPDDLDTDMPEDAIPEANHPGEACDVQAVVNLWGGAGPWLDSLDRTDPPMILVYGSEDWLLVEGQRVRDRCEAVGAAYEWTQLDGWRHGAWDALIGGQIHPAAILDFFQRQGVLVP